MVGVQVFPSLRQTGFCAHHSRLLCQLSLRILKRDINGKSDSRLARLLKSTLQSVATLTANLQEGIFTNINLAVTKWVGGGGYIFMQGKRLL